MVRLCGFLLLCFLNSQLAVAELPSAHVFKAFGSAAVGIVAGRPTPDDVAPQVVLVAAYKENNQVDYCSGFFIDGCVVTNAHCALDESSTIEIYRGERPNKRSLVARVTDRERLGDGNAPETDLAVLKLDRPVPQEITFSKDALATERAKPGDELRIVGYGNVGTIEGTDYGSGKRRDGHVKVDGYFKYDESTKDKKGGVGDAMFVSPFPNISTKGDSGGPAVGEGGRIYALISKSITVSHNHDTDELRVPGAADRTIGAAYTPVADHREKMLAMMKKFECGTSFVRSHQTAIFTELKENDWSKQSDSKKKEIANRLGALASAHPFTTAELTISGDSPKVSHLRLGYADGFVEHFMVKPDDEKKSIDLVPIP